MRKRLLFTVIIHLQLLIFYLHRKPPSQILGTVTDGKAGLAGATVVALHTPTGTKYSTTTRKDGRFNLPGLRIGGPYIVSVSLYWIQARQAGKYKSCSWTGFYF